MVGIWAKRGRYGIQQLELDIIFGKKFIFKHDSAHPLKIGYSDANEYTASFTVDSDTQITFIPFDKRVDTPVKIAG